MTTVAAIGLVIGSFVSGGSATPNFTRFAKSATSAVITTVIAFFIGNTLMFTFGAVGGAFTGKDDIFYVMIAQGLLIPALIVLGANIWTTNNNALYTTGLGYANITGINKKPLVLVAGIIGTLGALWLYDNFVGWLSLLNATLPPIGAVLVADYFARRRSYMDLGSNDPEVKWAPIVALIAGALTGWLTPGFGIVSINAMVVAILVYFVGSAIEKGIRR
ncbi:cytosine permease domain protein [Actinomyces sp. oral taxon 181 str. F0379]|nr:cytosine permease domain protein [Actinomyces sp. oral taxon 181 str. F0379]